RLAMLLCPRYRHHRYLHSFPTRRSSDLTASASWWPIRSTCSGPDAGTSWLSQSQNAPTQTNAARFGKGISTLDTVQELGRALKRSEEHTSELQSLAYLVCRLLLEKKKIQ